MLKLSQSVSGFASGGPLNSTSIFYSYNIVKSIKAYPFILKLFII